MTDSGKTQVTTDNEDTAADLEHQEEIKQAQVLQREGVETALMDHDSSEAGEEIDGVQEPTEEEVS